MRQVAAQVVENPEILITYSWRSCIATFAHRLGLTHLEKLALSAWMSKAALRAETQGETPMPIRYSGHKFHSARKAKMKIEMASKILLKDKIDTFAQYSSQEWANLGEELRQVDWDHCFSDKIIWCAPELKHKVRKFVVKPQGSFMLPSIEMPKVNSYDILMVSCDKRGEALCDAFQEGACCMQDEPRCPRGN